MKLSEFIQKMIKDFLMIFASIIILLTLLRQMNDSNNGFDLMSINIIIAFSFISALLGFILYSPYDISEKERRIRIAVHFFTLEILLIALCLVFDIVKNAWDVSILAVQIAAIYILIRLLSWRNDKKEAEKINEKLKALKKDVYVKE